jgi:glycosyltransferase involved in cell wall biosynthesis
LKIAIYWIGKDYGGVEEILKNLLNSWPCNKDEFFLFTNVKSNFGYRRFKKKFFFKKVFNILPDWNKNNFLIFKVIKYLFFPLFFLKYYNQTYKEISETKINFDILIVNNGGYPGSWKSMSSLKSATDLGIKKIFLLVHHGAVHDKFISRTGEKYLDKKIQDWATKVITISKATKNTLINNRKFNKKKIVVIYNGINPIKKKKFEKKKKKIFYIGILGRIESYKGHDNILRAMSLLKIEKKSNIQFLIAGKFVSNFEKKRIVNLINQYDLKKNVKFLGYISENKLRFFYSKLNLFFSITKDFEGFGLTILEAINNRVPVVCTNVGAVHEFVDKKMVSFVKPNDPISLRNIINKYFNNPKYFIKKTSHAYKIRYKFSSKNMAMNYYNEINRKI